MRYLTRLLMEKHRRAGLYLEEDEDLLYLMQGQRVLATFSPLGATVEAVQAIADFVLE